MSLLWCILITTCVPFFIMSVILMMNYRCSRLVLIGLIDDNGCNDRYLLNFCRAIRCRDCIKVRLRILDVGSGSRG